MENKVSLSKDIAELQSKCVDTPDADHFKELLTKTAKYDIAFPKCPAPNGFPSEFFKTFAIDTLSPLVLIMFNESLQNGSLPVTLRQATISLILKKDKDPLSCSNYHPSSLLCADVKILAKMPARWLECVLPTIIATGQTGL